MVFWPSEAVVWVCRSPRISARLMSFGSLPCGGGFDFAAVFAQLGIDEWQAQLLVDFLFGLARDGLCLRRPRRSFSWRLCRIRSSVYKPPFVERHPLIDCARPRSLTLWSLEPVK